MTLPAGPFSKGPAGFSARWGPEWVFGPEQVEAAVEADKQVVSRNGPVDKVAYKPFLW